MAETYTAGEDAGADTAAPINPGADNVSRETQSDDELLSALYDRIEAGEADDDDTEEAASPARDEQGRFKARDAEESDDEEDTAEAAAEAEDEDQTPDEETDEPAAAKPPAIDPPASWSAEMKAKWASLPSEVQQYAAQREQDTHKRISELGQQVAGLKPVTDTLAKHDTYLGQLHQMRGITREGAIDRLVQVSQFLDQDPASALRWIAGEYGVDLTSLVPDAYAENRDESVAALQNELAAYKQAYLAQQTDLQNMQRQHQQAAESERQQREQALTQAINTFASDKPDFDRLAPAIVGFVDAIRAANPTHSDTQILEEAYKAARLADPEARKALLAEEMAKAEQERQAKAAIEAKKAKKAGKLNVRGADQARTRAVTEDELLSSTWDRLHAN